MKRGVFKGGVQRGQTPLKRRVGVALVRSWLYGGGISPPHWGWGGVPEEVDMAISNAHLTHGSPAVRGQAAARLRSIEGHVRGVVRMVEEGAYCIDIIKQILAIQRALEKVNALLLEDHLETCASTAIRSADQRERERTIRELLDVFETSGRL